MSRIRNAGSTRIRDSLSLREEVFYSDRWGNRITNLRAVFGRRTFIVAHITSVTVGSRMPSRRGAVICILSGLLFAVLAHDGTLNWRMGAGALLALAGVIGFLAIRPWHYLALATAGGEVKAVQRRRRESIEVMATALTEAIGYGRP